MVSSALALLWCSAGTAAVRPDPTGPASVREAAEIWSAPVSSAARAAHPAHLAPREAARQAALEALASGRPAGTLAPTRCATSLLVALHQHSASLAPHARILLSRATRVDRTSSSYHDSPDGFFRIHYGVAGPDRVDAYDGDLDGTPDGVERLGQELSDTIADFVHRLDWAPAPGPGPVNVFLVRLTGEGEGPPLDGFAMPVTSGGAASEGSGAAIFLDSRLASAGAASRTAVIHQIAHMVLLRESAMESPWWHEASAAWLEDRLAGIAPGIATRLPRAPAGRPAGLDDDVLGLGQEGFLWPHYLGEIAADGVGLMRRLWTEMGAVPGNNTLSGTDAVLRRLFGSSLAEEVRAFNIWNLFVGEADDGRHYSFGSLLPTPRGEATFEVFPARGGSVSGPLPPFGAAVIHLLNDGSGGGLRVRFTGDPDGVWDVSLLVHFAEHPGDPRLIPVELDGDGRGILALPWRTISGAGLVIQNLATTLSGPADYSFAIERDPAIPFDLLTFTAREGAGGAVLDWTTDSEEGLAGWNIFRSSGPLGPFSRINTHLVPGAGVTDRTMNYLFVDATPEPGRKYYYYLEGVTFEGLVERSHPAGIRLGARSGRSPDSR